MSKSMAQSRSQPRPATFERVPQSRKNRNVAFKPFQTLIEKFYIHEGKELKWIMEYMKDEFDLDLSVKQYKSQFKNWGLRHNLTQRDAAFILRLLNQARQEGRDEVVIFSGHPRCRDYILKYIKRNDKILDEDDLLSCISDTDETPHHIKLRAPQLDLGRPTLSQLPPTPPSASPSGSGQFRLGLREVSPMRVQIPSPVYTPRSSGEILRPDAVVPPGQRLGGSIVRRRFSQVDVPRQRYRSSSRGETTVNGNSEPHQDRPPRSWQDDERDRQRQAERTHAILSSTPARVDELHDPDFDIYRVVGEQIRSPQLKDGSLPAFFVMYSLYWLACAGQDDATFQSTTDYHLNSALFTFLCMLTNVESPAEECLGALSVVAALFECYGQHEKLGELLKRCDELTKTHYGSDNPLTKTIGFMGDMLAGASCPPHDLPRLGQIMVDMHVIFNKSERPALTARYHLAWATLENELKKEERNPHDFEPIRRELCDLLEQCELHFGPDRLETIMVAATLARTTFWCGNGVKAEKILSHSVMPGVLENFVESHPYVWEAKHRHAFFLFQLAKNETDASRVLHLRHAERLLRGIVPARVRVLGDSNPKAKYSLLLLRDVLMAQGQVHEAETLGEWCEQELLQSNFA